MQDVLSIVVSVNEDTTYAVFVCAMSRYGTGRVASLRFSTPSLNPPVITAPSMHSLKLHAHNKCCSPIVMPYG